jgi:hypothetical protein
MIQGVFLSTIKTMERILLSVFFETHDTINKAIDP